jgi:riboflavin kinase / FMN adenylyltransferase
MQIYRKSNRALWNSVITIGSFDGIHRGHQEVIAKTIEIARDCKTKAGIVSFNPIPQQILHREFYYILTPFDEKRKILADLGIDFLFLINFDKRIQHLTPGAFIQNEILHILHPSTIVVGYDHHFGKDGEGNVDIMRGLAERCNFGFVVTPKYLFEGEPVKSTRIRERLLLGDVKTANRLLGRNYSLTGTVTKGAGIGKRIGFPTVNLKINEIEKLIPADGVYAVFVWFKGKRYLGAMDIGHRPTFGGENRTIETSLLNLNRNLYGVHLKIEVIERLRPERKFADGENLAQQIKKDLEKAKEILTQRYYNLNR